LGLVLFGGVSLAIYMNGVTNEIHRAARGRGAYFLIKELLDAEIVVDVLSGASAGGINGIFLGFALANQREFSACAELWRNEGALATLLRKTEELGGGVNSVLDSRHYQRLLTRGFAAMWTDQPKMSASAENPSPVKELDLFVTGTNFYGVVTRQGIGDGQTVDAKNHRTLFHLKHREGRKTQLSPIKDELGDGAASERAGLLALGKLAQISSSFPGAFAPVCVGDLPTDPDEVLADKKLKKWGGLEDGTHYFVDGGVLDNKPFTSTLDAIFYRTSERPVCRHLIYLEPDPERFTAEHNAAQAPSFVRTILDSGVRLPAYQSISADLAAISDHNRALSRFEQLLKLSSPPLTQANCGAILPRETDLSYVRTCYLGLAQTVWDELSEESFRFSSKESEAQFRTLEETLTSEAGLGIDKLSAIDVQYPLRRLMDLTYALHEADRQDLTLARTAEAVEQAHRRRNLWRKMNVQIEILEIIRSALFAALVPPLTHPTESYWNWANARARALLSLDGLRDLVTLADLQPLKDKLERRRLEYSPQEPPAPSIICHLMEQQDREVLGSGVECAKIAFNSFPARDRIRYPLELASGLHELDQIHITRFSPVDAQREYCQRELKDKLTGENLGHFSAFLKRAWRSNDILWGRLDGVCQLLEVLLTRTKFSTKGDPCVLHLGKLRAALSKPNAPKLADLFPALARRSDGMVQLAELTHWIKSGPELNSPETRDNFLNLIVRVAQLDVLCEELPNVMADAAFDQLSWNQYLKYSPESSKKDSSGSSKEASRVTRFEPGKATLDPELVEATVRKLAQDYAKNGSAAELGHHFKSDYAIGSEGLSAIPTSILVALAAQAAVITERALVTRRGKIEGFVQKSWGYGLIIRLPLQVISGFAQAIKRSPSSQRTAIVAVLGYIALSVAINCIYRSTIYQGAGLSHNFALVAFLIVPGLLFVPLAIWVRGYVARILVLLLILLVGSTVLFQKVTASQVLEPCPPCVREVAASG